MATEVVGAGMSEWQLALNNVATAKVKAKSFCDYCGNEVVSPPNVTSKKYCDRRCQRDARYLREHGRRPVRRFSQDTGGTE